MMLIVATMKWIMLVSGLLTTTMLYAFVDPHGSLRSTFGETLEGNAAALVVRNWGLLIALVGGMLIYGAFNTAVRPLVLSVAGISKVVFIGLILSHGSQYLPTAGLPVAVDSLMVVLFAWYLVAAGRSSATPAGRGRPATV
jgi:hypothetical protein